MARSRKPKTEPARRAAPLQKPQPNGSGVFPSPAAALSETPQYGPPAGSGPLPSAISPERAWMFKLTRFSPIRQLDPERLAQQIDMWYAGTLRPLALMMEAVEKRDDILASVVPKRKGAVARRKLEIMLDEDADPVEAEKHACVLRYFYKNLTATHAVDQNEVGGVALLLTQMMDAQMKKYAVHELAWTPTDDMIDLTLPDGEGRRKVVGQTPGLTANFNFVPSWFFENRTGKLRFLLSDFAYAGVDIEDGAWMVTVGLGLMEAAVVAYMFKKLGMQDWLLYCQRHGMPGVQGKTNFPIGSDGHNAMVTAVQSFAANFSCVTNNEDEIVPIDMSAQGALPYPPLVERMDRVLAALMRGADLSSMSAHHTAGSQGGGQGASLQGEESHIVESDDAMKLSETLQRSIDPLVVEYHFGAGTKPLAKAVIVVPPEKDEKSDLEIIQGLVALGCKIGQNETMQKFGISPMNADDEPMTAPQPAASAQDGDGDPDTEGDLVNERAEQSLIQNSEQLFREANYAALRPLADRVLGVMELPDNAIAYGMQKLRDDLPSILRGILEDPRSASVLKDAMAAGWFNGVITEAVGSHISGARN